MATAQTHFHPVTIRLNDQRTLFVELPQSMIRRDRDGSIGYTLEGVRFMDKLRALAMEVPPEPSPGHIAALRDALGMTQKTFGEKLGVDKLTVSRWERGDVKPSPESAKRLKAIRRDAARKGVIVAA
jgi:DNA-binding transcriptional regulator YiaG